MTQFKKGQKVTLGYLPATHRNYAGIITDLYDTPKGVLATVKFKDYQMNLQVCDIMPIERTKTIFRLFKGEIIALFPYIDEGNGLCSSYMHNGQHSPADCISVIHGSKPATFCQYKDLLVELEAIGYDIEVIDKTCKPVHEDQPSDLVNF